MAKRKRRTQTFAPVRLLIDTCVWLDLAKDHRDQPLIGALEDLWRVDESGTYTFSDATDPNQSVLFSAEPDRQLLTRLILARFAGAETTPDEIEHFVVRYTPFRETHYKKVLQSLEYADKIVPLSAPARRRRGTCADVNMRLSIKPK